MTDNNPTESRLQRWLPGIILGIFVLACLAFVGALFVYWWTFPGPVIANHSQWGEFGDFLGGTVNPIFGLLGLLALLLTLVLQNQELRNSTKELATSARALTEQSKAAHRNNFEGMFFELIRLHHDIVRALDYSTHLNGAISRSTGRDCFRKFYDVFSGDHSDANLRFASQGQAKIVEEAYGDFHARCQHQTGHYFRNLHRLLKFIDDNATENVSDYTGTVRAQLSSYELVLLFYNCLHPVGAKMQPLVVKYALLENLDVGLLRNRQDEVVLFDRSAFGDQQGALFEGSA